MSNGSYGCKYDLDTNDKQTIMVSVCSLMASHTHPQTIVWSVCDYLNIPPASGLPVTETNWCLVSCISSCLFAGTTFFTASSFTYNNVPQTLYCITSCFPPPETPPGGSAPAEASSGEADPAKMEALAAAQVAEIQNNADQAISWLESEIDRTIEMMAVIAAGYAIWIAIFAAEAMLEAIAYGIKTTAEIGHDAQIALKGASSAALDGVAGVMMGQQSTETASGHVHTAIAIQSGNIQHAFLSSADEILDQLDSGFSVIHTEGTKTTATANEIFDIAQIALAEAALAAEMEQCTSFIAAMEGRIEEVKEQAAAGIEQVSALYTDKIDSMNGFIEQGEELLASNEIVVDYDGTSIDDMVNDILVEDL